MDYDEWTRRSTAVGPINACRLDSVRGKKAKADCPDSVPGMDNGNSGFTPTSLFLCGCLAAGAYDRFRPMHLVYSFKGDPCLLSTATFWLSHTKNWNS